MQVRYLLNKFDWVILIIPCFLVLVGIMTFANIGPSADAIIERQALFLVIGIFVMFLVSLFDYRIFKNYSAASVSFYVVTILLLLLTLASREIRGVNSWLSFGAYSLEPSELAKLSLIILLAKYFSQKHVHIYYVRHIIASGFYAAVPAFLVFIQPDLGSAVVLIMIWGVMLLSSGVKKKHFGAIVLVGLVAAVSTWIFILKPYQKIRITTFLNPYIDPRGEGYSIIQSRFTTGSGRIFGTAWSRDTDSMPVLVPEPYTDFTFSVFSQKFGFIGIAVIIGAFIFLSIRIVSLVNMTNNNFAKLFSLGMLTLIFTHVFINAGMNIGLLPITGIPFSFISYGGSHLLTLFLSLGIIESIRLHS